MLRCRGVGLLTRNACLSGAQVLSRGPHLVRLAADRRLHREDCTTPGERRAFHEEGGGRVSTSRKNRGRNNSSSSLVTNGIDFAPMSEFEYEKSLWEATNAPTGSEPRSTVEISTQAEATKPIQKQADAPSRSHRPNDHASKSKPGSAGVKTSENSLKHKENRSKGPRHKQFSSDISKSRLQKGTPVHMKTTRPHDIEFKPIHTKEDLEIPRLAHNLERALFNPGVFQLQDPRSKVFNFDPYLSSIMPVDEFDFDALREYITSSKDVKLHEMSKKHGVKYCGSTSSMTNMLSHFHYLISNWRPPAFPSITEDFSRDSNNFTQLTRAPASTYIHHNDGVYAMDADKEFDFGRENVLMMLGHSMEKLLTLPPEEFEKYRVDRSHLIPQETRDAGANAFHYGTIGKFMMRSQLDAQDPRLPGTGVFDIKTRAVLPIRIDLKSYKDHVGYEIKDRFGQLESFEREYYDLIRAAFLKYSLQVRIGRMDGCFVAYHNTRRIFGFQYVSLDEMDQALHGTSDRRIGDQEFKLSVEMLEKLLDMATERYPGRQLQISVETRDTKPPVMYFFARPVNDEDIRKSDEKAMGIIDKTQSDMAKARAEEETLLETEPVQEAAMETESDMAEEDEATASEDSAEVSSTTGEGNPIWEEMIAKVEEVVENEAMGVDSVRDAVQNALHENDMLDSSNQESSDPSIASLVEALVAEMTDSRHSRESTEAEAITDHDIAQEAPSGNDTPVETPTQSSGDPREATAEHDSDSVLARTQELKELIVKFTNAVDRNASQARGFERALGKILTKSGTPNPVEEGTAAEEGIAAGGQLIAEIDSGLSHGEGAASTTDTATVAHEQTDNAEAGADSARADTVTGNDRSAKRHSTSDFSPIVPEELFSAVISVVNHQNGQEVPRPVSVHGSKLQWTVHYTIHEMDRAQAERVYPALQKRRYDIFGNGNKRVISPKDREKFIRMSKEGAKRRRKEEASGQPLFVAWDDNPLKGRKSGKKGKQS